MLQRERDALARQRALAADKAALEADAASLRAAADSARQQQLVVDRLTAVRRRSASLSSG